MMRNTIWQTLNTSLTQLFTASHIVMWWDYYSGSPTAWRSYCL